MLRLPKLTDYAVVLLNVMARAPDRHHNTTGLATLTTLPLPTVAKILKLLTKSGILGALRGTRGGYRLARAPEAITIADIVVALDGPVAVTDCVDNQHGHCAAENHCAMRGQWNTINQAIRSALEAVTLADMQRASHAHFMPAAQTTPHAAAAH